MFTVFYVWSKSLSTNTSDYTSDPLAGGVVGNQDTIRQYDYSYSGWDRPHNFVANFIYQTPKVTEQRPEVAGERLADLGCLPLVERYSLRDPILDPRHREREPERHEQPGRARRRHLRPG